MRQATIDAAILGALIAGFLALATYQLQLPGLYYDEALDAVPAMQIVARTPIDLPRDAGITIGRYTYPLMVMDYVGPVNTYLLVPVFRFFGPGVLQIRLLMVAGAAVGLVLSFVVVRRLLGRAIATTATLMLALSPSFIFWSRQGIHVTSVMLPILAGALLALDYRRRTGSPVALLIGAFLLGVGLTAKLLFLWFIGALVIAGIAIALAQRRIAIRMLDIGLAVVGLLLGAAPLIAYNVETKGTLDVLGKNLTTTSTGVNNLAVWANLQTRIQNVEAVVTGNHFWYLGGFPGNPIAWAVFLAGGALGLLSLLNRSTRQQYRPLGFALGFVAVVVVESVVTVSNLLPTHYYALMPWIYVVTAGGWIVATATIQDWARGQPAPGPRRLARLAVVVTVLVLTATTTADLAVDLKYHQLLATTGGYFTHSDAIYRLAAYLDRIDARTPVAMDWGIARNVQILTQGRVNPVEVFLYAAEPPPLFDDLLYKYLIKPGSVFIFHVDDATIFPRRQRFQYWLDRLQKQAILEQEIRQRNGKVLFQVYVVP